MSLVIALLLMELSIWFFANQESEPIERSRNLYWMTFVLGAMPAVIVVMCQQMNVNVLYSIEPLCMFCTINLTIALSISRLRKYCPAQ